MALLNIGDEVTIQTLDMYGTINPIKTGVIREHARIENKMQYLVEYPCGDEDWFDESELMGALIKKVEHD